MRLLGFISDAHGNPLGLKVCIQHLRAEGVVDIFFLGDAIGYLPMASEVLKILDIEQVTVLMGNHEAMLCQKLPLDPEKDKVYRLHWLRSQLDYEVCQKIAVWPTRLELEVSNRKILLVHGSPWQELTGYIYPDTDLKNFTSLDCDVVFLAHTHLPFIKYVKNKLVVNVGSCGLPRDKGNLASCAIYNVSENKAFILRIPFDVEKTISLSQTFYPLPPVVFNCLHR